MTQIGILTGLAAEARVLRGVFRCGRALPIVARAAADSTRARDQAERLIASGAVALVSFGIAGGLDPELEAGDLVLADRVVLPDGRAVATDRAWLHAALDGASHPGLRVRVGSVAGTDRILASVAEKRHAAGRSGALVADMESAALAEAADRAGLPFLVVRAVSDSAARGLPRVAQTPLKPCGGIRFDAVAQALCSYPGEWPAVARLAMDTRSALNALRSVVQSGALLPPALREPTRRPARLVEPRPGLARLAA